MRISDAFQTAQAGLLKTFQSLAKRADRVADFGATKNADQLATDLVTDKIDQVQAKADMKVIRIADSLMQEFIADQSRKK